MPVRPGPFLLCGCSQVGIREDSTLGGAGAAGGGVESEGGAPCFLNLDPG